MTVAAEYLRWLIEKLWRGHARNLEAGPSDGIHLENVPVVFVLVARMSRLEWRVVASMSARVGVCVCVWWTFGFGLGGSGGVESTNNKRGRALLLGGRG